MSRTSQPDSAPKIGHTSKGTPYVVNEAAIAEIVGNVRSGHYCTVLGPPYSQKSLLLRDVRTRLHETGNEVCVLLDLAEAEAPSDEDFLATFAVRFAESYHKATRSSLSVSLPTPTQERDLQNFLRDSLLPLRGDLILLLDHLERVRLGPLKSLLRVLRALYIERNSEAPFRLVVVTANALNTAALALGPTSPFNIARIILIPDLNTAESETLIKFIFAEQDIKISAKGVHACNELTGGDRDLIRKLSMHCLDVFAASRRQTVGELHLAQTVEWFMAEEARKHRPLQEVIRAIEAVPDTLMNILQILRAGQCFRRELRLDLAAEVDDLLLTGAVRAVPTEQGLTYRIRNEVYEHYLRQHFVPSRVVHVLGVSGQWHEAIPYLQDLVAKDHQYRSTLLATLVNAIHAAPQITEACRYVVDSLTSAFGASQVRLYLISDARSRLNQVYGLVTETGTEPDILLAERQRAEVRAFLGEETPFEENYAVARTYTEEHVLLVPLIYGDGNRLGVIAIHGFQADPRSEDFQELLAFLGPVGQAIGSAIDRERKIHQLDVLNRTGRQVTSNLDLKRVLLTVVEAAIEAVPAAQKGSLFLWDATRKKLIIEAQMGFHPDIAEVLQLDEGEGYAGWVYRSRQALRLDNVLADWRTKQLDHPDVIEEKSAICVPLEAWGRILGVLCLDNTTTHAAFRDDDMRVLAIFGAQAAIAIQNARLYTELYQLSMSINRSNVRIEDIFDQTVQSIMRVSDARAANMILGDLYGSATHVPHKNLRRISRGLGPDYDAQVLPRPDGLTLRALEGKGPLTVSRPDQPPGIHPLAVAQGIQAYACLPLKVRETIAGVLFVHYDQVHEFSTNEIEMLSLFANQAALAIENREYLDERQRQLRYLAHATTTPLTGIGLLVEQLHHPTSPALAELSYRTIRKALADLDTMARNSLEFARHAEATLEIKPEHLDLMELVRATFELFKPEAEQEDVALRADLPDAPVMARIDKARITQVLHNLVKNALYAFPPGYTQTKIVEIWLDARPDWVAVRVSDTGKGIAREEQEQVFEPFFSQSGRTGVGLYISRMIAQAHGGELTVTSQVGKGSTFQLTIPRRNDR